MHAIIYLYIHMHAHTCTWTCTHHACALTRLQGYNNNHYGVHRVLGPLEKWFSYITLLCAQGCKSRRPTNNRCGGNYLFDSKPSRNPYKTTKLWYYNIIIFENCKTIMLWCYSIILLFDEYKTTLLWYYNNNIRILRDYNALLS